MNIQQPALGAIKSYYRQILTQPAAFCELAYKKSELPINTLINSGKRLGDESFLFIQKQEVLPASLSKSIFMLKSGTKQELSLEFAKLKQASTSQLYLPLNIKQTDAAMLHQVHLHPAPSYAQHSILIQLALVGKKASSYLAHIFCLA